MRKTYLNQRRRKLFRSRNGVILGVFEGISDYTGYSAFWMRAVAVVLLILTGLWPVGGIYILAALLMTPEPKTAVSAKRARAARKMKQGREWADRQTSKAHDHLNDRIRNLEEILSNRAHDWDRRFYREMNGQ